MHAQLRRKRGKSEKWKRTHVHSRARRRRWRARTHTRTHQRAVDQLLPGTRSVQPTLIRAQHHSADNHGQEETRQEETHQQGNQPHSLDGPQQPRESIPPVVLMLCVWGRVCVCVCARMCASVCELQACVRRISVGERRAESLAEQKIVATRSGIAIDKRHSRDESFQASRATTRWKEVPIPSQQHLPLSIPVCPCHASIAPSLPSRAPLPWRQ